VCIGNGRRASSPKHYAHRQAIEGSAFPPAGTSQCVGCQENAEVYR
jgi:hypothetical protein